MNTLDELTQDMVSACTTINRTELVYVSLVKRELAGDMPANFRFRFLQWLDGRARPNSEWENLPLTPGVIAVVEPMDDRAYGELMGEIMKLGKFDRINAVGREDVFSAFVALNPSLLTAIKMGQEMRAS